MNFICFTGTDCSGKDSLMHELAKLYNYKYYMSPRSPICNIVYDIIYNRETPEQKFYNFNLLGDFLKIGAYFVFIKVQPDILHKRAVARNEKHVSSIEDFKKHIEIYQDVIEECKIVYGKYLHRFVEIDNSGNLLEAAQTLKTILDRLRQREKNDKSK